MALSRRLTYRTGGMLHVTESGHGHPVVFLHGAPTTPDHLAPLAQRLAPSRRCLQVHLPGYGQSPPLTPYRLDESHALVERTLAERGVVEADLVGFSGGAYRALALASRGHLRVRRVVSLAGLMGLFPDERLAMLDTVRMVRAGVALGPLLPAAMLSPAWRSDVGALAEIAGWGAACPPAALADELEAFADAPPLDREVAGLEAPILVRVGTADLACPLPRSHRIARAARRAVLEEVPGVGHALLVEDRLGTVEAVARFLLDA